MILKLWKEFGVTSNEFVRKYGEENGIDKLCYAGRLDPMAQGVMVVLTGAADVRRMKEFMNKSKTYRFKMVLGVSTESLDPLGKIKEMRYDVALLDVDYIDLLQRFVKSYSRQVYPLVSQYKVEHAGMRKSLLWFYANGYRDLELPSKQVQIYDYKIHAVERVDMTMMVREFLQRLSLVVGEKTRRDIKVDMFEESWRSVLDCDDGGGGSESGKWMVVDMELHVNGGFYIRQFCEDFGKYVGVPAMAFDITRVSVDC